MLTGNYATIRSRLSKECFMVMPTLGIIKSGVIEERYLLFKNRGVEENGQRCLFSHFTFYFPKFWHYVCVTGNQKNILQWNLGTVLVTLMQHEVGIIQKRARFPGDWSVNFPGWVGQEELEEMDLRVWGIICLVSKGKQIMLGPSGACAVRVTEEYTPLACGRNEIDLVWPGQRAAMKEERWETLGRKGLSILQLC